MPIQRTRESTDLVEGENRVLELIAANAPLRQTLLALVNVVEALSPGMLASIVLINDDRLDVDNGAAPSFPDAYNRAVQGLRIGPAVGSCGTAAFRREAVIVEDIATDPLWEQYRHIALQYDLRACWSTPIFEESGHPEKLVLGTFALYFHSPGAPDEWHRKLVDMATHTASIAIVRSRETDALRRREMQLTEAQRIAHVGSYEWDLGTGKVDRSAELCKIFGLADDQFERTLDGYLKMIHPDDRLHTLETLQQALRTCETFDHEERIVRADGTVRVLRSQGKFICDNNGEATKLVGICQDITERKLAQRELEALSARVISAQEEERGRLARELHDDLGQQIAAVSVALSNLRRILPGELDSPREQVERIRGKVIQVAESLRRLSHELHPAILQHCRLDVVLRALCSEFEKLFGMTVAFTAEGVLDGIPPPVALCVYRVTQEALQNVAKHAKTNRASVALKHVGLKLEIVISDSGIGMAPNGTIAGLGLTSIKERTRVLNGSFAIQSEPECGTTLRVIIPV